MEESFAPHDRPTRHVVAFPCPQCATSLEPWVTICPFCGWNTADPNVMPPAPPVPVGRRDGVRMAAAATILGVGSFLARILVLPWVLSRAPEYVVWVAVLDLLAVGGSAIALGLGRIARQRMEDHELARQALFPAQIAIAIGWIGLAWFVVGLALSALSVPFVVFGN